MMYVDSALLDFTERLCRRFQTWSGRTNVWLAFQLTNLSIVVYFAWVAVLYWLTGMFALRVFVKITLTLLALGAAIMMGLSYFNITNIDLTPAKTKYDSAIHWAKDQGYKLKDSAQSHLPNTGGGALGAFAGFRRKRIVT